MPEIPSRSAVTPQNVVQHAVREARVSVAAEHQPEEDRPGEQLGRYLGVGIRAKVAAGDPAGDDSGDPSRRARTTVARNGSPIVGFTAIWERSARSPDRTAFRSRRASD